MLVSNLAILGRKGGGGVSPCGWPLTQVIL